MRRFKYKNFKTKSKNVHVIFDKVVWDEPPHIHDFIEIIYISSGRIVEKINEDSFELGEGNLLVLNTNDIHSFKKTMPSSYYNICFYENSLDNLMNQKNDYSSSALSSFLELINTKQTINVFFKGEERREIENIFRSMHLEERSQGNHHEMVEQSYLNILFAKILDKIGAEKAASLDTWGDIVSYIDENLDGDLSLKTLADLHHYNESYFCRLFKSHFKMTFGKFIQIRRVERAKALLANTSKTIDEIKDAVGFQTKSAFYKSFVKEAKITPHKYRKSSSIS